MKVLAIGDIHGRDSWKKLIDQEWDRCIFIGDYFDNKDVVSFKRQMKNFKEILEFKKSGKDVVLLFGNHDFHYLRGIDEHYTGYQPLYAHDIGEILSDNIKLFDMCHQIGDTVYSHAGITKTFLKRIQTLDMVGMTTVINMFLQSRPNIFKFFGIDKHGDDVTQSPIWVRPSSLLLDSIDKNQVVGHSKVEDITQSNFVNLDSGKERSIYLIDCLAFQTKGLILEYENDKTVG